MRGFRSALFAWAVPLLLASTVSAMPIYVDAVATGANNGSTWEDAFTHLQAALAIAASGDSVLVARGTYRPGDDSMEFFDLAGGISLVGSYAGHASPQPSERDFARYPSILSGEIGTAAREDNCVHIVQVTSGEEMALLDGFVVTRGYAHVPNMGQFGAGLNVVNGSATVRNARFEDNFASRDGGAVYCVEGKIVLERVEFANNSTGLNQNGGNGGGLAISCSDGKIVDCVFRGNIAQRQGGALFYYDCVAFEHSLEVTQCLFENNSGTHAVGGALRFYGGRVIVRDVIFRDNTAAFPGGGAIFGLSEESSFVNCVFLNNSADDNGSVGGAIYFADFLTVSPVLTNCTFVGNQYAEGAAVAILGSHITPIVTNCILWGNSGGPQINGGTISHSIVEGSGGSGGWNVPNAIDGGGNLDTDPLFVDAAQGDLHVTALSPAIDSGDVSAPALPPRDLDGAPRVSGTTVDMGVFEFPSALEAAFSDDPDSGLLRSVGPNPSSGSLEVVFELARATDVSLEVYDVRGRVVSTLMRGVVASGVHRVSWAPAAAPAGMYFVRIRAEKIIESRKVLVLR